MTRSAAPTAAHLKRERVDAVGGLLTQARSVLFITGPAMSQESELPMYRGIGGLHRKRPEDGKLFEAALTPETLHAKPQVTWRYLLQMEHAIRRVRPSRGHEILAALERAIPRTRIMTVNVDRLHQTAGSRGVIEMHGSLFDLACRACEMTTRHATFDDLDMPPLCASCAQPLRPEMPLFGESLPADPFTRLQAELDEGFDIVIVVGVPAMYPYLARPVLLARSEGVPTVEISAQRTDVSDVVDFRFKGTPTAVLGDIWAVFSRLRENR